MPLVAAALPLESAVSAEESFKLAGDDEKITKPMFEGSIKPDTAASKKSTVKSVKDVDDKADAKATDVSADAPKVDASAQEEARIKAEKEAEKQALLAQLEAIKNDNAKMIAENVETKMQKMDEMAAFKRMATRKIDAEADKEDEKRYLEAIVAKQKEENDRKISENEAIKKQKQEEEAALAAQATVNMAAISDKISENDDNLSVALSEKSEQP